MYINGSFCLLQKGLPRKRRGGIHHNQHIDNRCILSIPYF